MFQTNNTSNFSVYKPIIRSLWSVHFSMTSSSFKIETRLRLHHVDNLWYNGCHKFNTVKILEICVNDIIFNSALRKVARHYSIPIFGLRNFILTSMQVYHYRQSEKEFPKYLRTHRKRRDASSKRFCTRVIRKRVKCHLCDPKIPSVK